MEKNYYIATNNKNKAKEITKILGAGKVILEENLINYEEPIEDGETFAENSEKKAKSLYEFIHNKMEANDLIIADDSGIIIPSLGKDKLGVYTKRNMIAWIKKEQKSEDEFWEYIANKAGQKAKAFFVAAITIIKTSGETIKIEESLEGMITSPKGKNGFAFDTIFQYDGKTLAERTDDEKQIINPRISALKQLLRYLKEDK